MIDLRKIFGPRLRGNIMYALSFLPDKLYLRLFYFATTGRMIHYRNPKGYNEKLQWLKIYDRHPEHSKLVDKLAVREHIAEVLGEEYLFPLLGYWKSFDEIDFSQLPDQFVLKCTHDSGSTKVIRDKTALGKQEIDALKEHFDRRLSHDFFYAGREFPYKGVPRFILAEQLMTYDDAPEKSIEEFKFFCFNGEPQMTLVVTYHPTGLKYDFYDMEFNHLDVFNLHPNSDAPIEKPARFEEMRQIAAKLSQGMRFVRIDLYELNKRIYFGEYTFYHGGGFQLFHPEKWERQMGEWLDLDSPCHAPCHQPNPGSEV